jgi:hypothetical protein
MQQLFQYAVIYNVNSEEKKKGEKDKLIVPITDVLAHDQAAATLLAGRSIPEEYLSKLDQITVVCKPF